MSNKIFIDSSILIEFRKGSKSELLSAIFSSDQWTPTIPSVVVSEYLFHHLAIFSGKSPLSVKSSRTISQYIRQGNPDSFLANFRMLPELHFLIEEVADMMGKYNLLPNDAMILAHCKSVDIHYIASHDSDFAIPCKEESIKLINKSEDLVV